MNFRRMGSWSLLAVFALFAACDEDSTTNPTPEPGSAQVRVAHLSPDTDLVDVWVDGTRVLQDVSFKQFSPYLQVPAGDRQVQVVAAGTTSPAVIDATLTVAEGTSYTVAATGLFAEIGASVFVDDLETTMDKAELRFVHAVPGVDPVDITLLDGTVLFDDVAFGTAGARLPVDEAAYSLQVRLAGTDTVALSFADVAVADDTNYTVFAVGPLADGSLDAIVAVDAVGETTTVLDLTPATADVRVAHFVPGAPNVDVIVGGDEVLSGVPFDAVSDYLTVPAATVTVRVVVENTLDDVIPTTALTFLPNSASTVAAIGTLTDGISALVVEDSRDTPAAGNAWVRLVHVSPDAPAVDVLVQDGPVLFAGVAFPESTDYSTVPSGTYDLEVRVASDPAGQGAFVKAFPGVVLGDAGTFSIFATGLAESLNANRVQDN